MMNLNSFCFELLKREKCSHGLNHILLPLKRTGKRKKKGQKFRQMILEGGSRSGYWSVPFRCLAGTRE